MCLSQILSEANSFEISDIQDDEAEAALKKAARTMLHLVGNRRMEFSVCTVGQLYLARQPPLFRQAYFS